MWTWEENSATGERETKQNTYSRAHGITSVVKDLTKGRRRRCSASLLSICSIKELKGGSKEESCVSDHGWTVSYKSDRIHQVDLYLIQKEKSGVGVVHPSGSSLGHSRAVVKEDSITRKGTEKSTQGHLEKGDEMEVWGNGGGKCKDTRTHTQERRHWEKQKL